MVLIVMVLVDIDSMEMMVKHLVVDFPMLYVVEFVVVVIVFVVHSVLSTQNMYLRTIF